MTKFRSKVFVASDREAGLRLGNFVKTKTRGHFSGKEIQEAIHRGICCVNGSIERFSSYRIQKGDKIAVDLDRLTQFTREKESDHYTILFDDEHIVCINKPFQTTCNEGTFFRWHLVHRLDKDTSGCLLLAKTKPCQKLLLDMFAERELAKTYLAIVHGSPQKNAWEIRSNLAESESIDGQTKYASGAEGKEAITFFEVVERLGDFTVVKCLPETGRTHQIRVHLSESGYPIVGDLLYGKKKELPKGVVRQLLHAYSLRFTHPVTKQVMHITAPIPRDFRDFLKKSDLR